VSQASDVNISKESEGTTASISSTACSVPATTQLWWLQAHITSTGTASLSVYKTGHIARHCRLKFTAAMEHQHQGYYRSPPQQEYFRPQSYPQNHNPSQFRESDMKESVQNCGPPAPSGSAKTATPPVSKSRSSPPPEFRPPAPTHAPILPTCRQHRVVDCEKCFSPLTTTHHCQALSAICQHCGQQHPVIADACQSYRKNINMPVANGLLEEQPVQVLRDTGCSAVIVRGSLVSKDKLTGQEAKCVLIDGTIHRAPVVQVFRDTPYFTGTITAVCMENPLYDVVVGNIRGATNPTTSQPASAVQTRSPVKETRDQAFQELKKRINSPPILRLPDASQPFILQTDASSGVDLW